MPGGRITRASTRTTAVLLTASLVDPTLLCITGALAIAPVAAGGLAYHAAKKGIASGKKSYREHKARKEATGKATTSQVDVAEDQIVEYQAYVRRIASAATGVAIRGTKAAVMPHLSVVVFVNWTELIAAVKQLRKLREQDVHRAVSGMSKTEHVVIGVVLKLLVTELDTGTRRLLRNGRGRGRLDIFYW